MGDNLTEKGNSSLKEELGYDNSFSSVSITNTDNFSITDEIKFVRMVWCDNANVIRAKTVHINSFKDSNYFVGISKAQQGVPVTVDGVVPESGLDPVGEVQLTADMSSFMPITYSNGHGRVMGNMMTNGSPWEHCPRDFLKKMIKKASKWELELKGPLKMNFTF